MQQIDLRGRPHLGERRDLLDVLVLVGKGLARHADRVARGACRVVGERIARSAWSCVARSLSSCASALAWAAFLLGQVWPKSQISCEAVRLLRKKL